MPTQRAREFVGNGPFTPLPYGLFSVADFPPPVGPHWANGIIRTPEICGPANSTLDPCGLGGAASITKSPSSTGIPATGADPFTVYGYIDCGPIGGDRSYYEDLVRTHLERGEERAAERVFWTGSVTTTGAPLINPHLAENAVVIGPNGETSQLAASPVTTGTGVTPTVALGLIEDALSECYGGVGVIHVPRVLIPILDAAGAIHREDGVITTLNGNLVAAGSGYPGTSPASENPLPGQVWIYATGAVSILRGEVTVTPWNESINQTENQLVLIAERTYVIDWDCCLFGAQVLFGAV